MGGNTFGWALRQMQNGSKVARSGWNGKGMWVALTPGSTIDFRLARAGAALHLASEAVKAAPDLNSANAVMLKILPHIDMRAADGSLVVGWLASQTDMLAEDWSVVE